jgi:hypothetical protein
MGDSSSNHFIPRGVSRIETGVVALKKLQLNPGIWYHGL